MAELLNIDWSETLAIDCIDDRGLADSGQNIKIAAGAYGLSQDLHVARSMRYPETQNESLHSLGEAAKIITAGLGRSALAASTHQMCAAEQGIITVGRTIIDRPDEVLSAAKQIIRGDITTNQYEQVSGAYDAMLFRPGTQVFRSVELEAECMDTNDRYRSIVRKLLANDLHVADGIQVNHVPYTWFDTAESYREGNATYHVDQWAIEPIAEIIDEVLPHDNINGFVLASSIRTAAVSLLLPRNGDTAKPGLDIHVVAA